MVYIRNDCQYQSSLLVSPVAYLGFRELGFEISFFTDINSIAPERGDIVVGYIQDSLDIFKRLGITVPVLDYPDELTEYFCREIKTVSLEKLIEDEVTGVFIKPAGGFKSFSGKVIRRSLDYAGMDGAGRTVYCSPVLEIRTEWRCYVRYGEIADVRRYRGDWSAAPDRGFIDKVISAYGTAPAAYALDVGLTREGEYFLVEVTDGYSTGTYGIMPINYAKFLSARWSELMGTADPLR